MPQSGLSIPLRQPLYPKGHGSDDNAEQGQADRGEDRINSPHPKTDKTKEREYYLGSDARIAMPPEKVEQHNYHHNHNICEDSSLVASLQEALVASLQDRSVKTQSYQIDPTRSTWAKRVEESAGRQQKGSFVPGVDGEFTVTNYKVSAFFHLGEIHRRE